MKAVLDKIADAFMIAIIFIIVFIACKFIKP